MTQENKKNIYQLICEAQKRIAEVGVAKNQKISQGGRSYDVRGVDDLNAVISMILPEVGIAAIPVFSEMERSETRGDSRSFFYSKTKLDLTLFSREDGSSVTVTAYGAGNDFGDKDTTKAQTMAIKYAYIYLFAIPVSGIADADSHSSDEYVQKEKPVLRYSEENIHPVIKIHVKEIQESETIEDLVMAYVSAKRNIGNPDSNTNRILKEKVSAACARIGISETEFREVSLKAMAPKMYETVSSAVPGAEIVNFKPPLKQEG